MAIQKEVSRHDVETNITRMGDFVKMDYLMNCLRKNIDMDTKRFVLLKLTDLYEERKMFLEAGKMMHNAAPVNPSEKGRVNDLIRAMTLFIKAGNINEADSIFEKTLAYGSEEDKWLLKQRRIDEYKAQAKIYILKDKRRSAVAIFEKLLTLNLASDERAEVEKNLLSLYERLGKIRDYYNLKRKVQ